ncbi:MAG: N-acetyltransferase family protein [Cyanobacteria bacterium P01_C01_bin.118]
MSDTQSATPRSSLKIRPAELEDCGAIASIYNEAIAHGGITMDGQLQTAEDIQALLAKFNQREVLLVAEVDSSVVGWGVIKRYSDRIGYQVCCETSVYLSFSETGKGYGEPLQRSLIKRVSELGYYHIIAKILGNNQGSIRFHQRLGFTVVGIQKDIGYIDGTWHDVVILQYLLPKKLFRASN